MKHENANAVEKNLLLTNTPKQKHVAENVPQNFVEIEEITFDGCEDVYNMEVECHHNFSVNGGFIIHNCLDALRYSVTDAVGGKINKLKLLDRNLLF